jgi:hypothetical protein
MDVVAHDVERPERLLVVTREVADAGDVGDVIAGSGVRVRPALGQLGQRVVAPAVDGQPEGTTCRST